jgi:hypothetical protein
MRLLQVKNGFYAFESALHVFPLIEDDQFDHQDLIRWNLPNTWKQAFGEKAEQCFAFAEDVFGYQFCFYECIIVRFDPETGHAEEVCSSMEEWSRIICNDFDFQTGYSIAKAWQDQHGPLKQGSRLIPIIPLVSSEGSYAIDNFYEVSALKGMLSRADFARQIEGVKDGEKVRIVPLIAS